MYDSRQPLDSCEFPELHKRIGVLASPPFHHHGANATYVDVSRETLRVSTGSYGSCYPVEDAAGEVERATRDTIADLDKVIADLTGHRDRLRRELGDARESVSRALAVE